MHAVRTACKPWHDASAWRLRMMSMHDVSWRLHMMPTHDAYTHDAYAWWLSRDANAGCLRLIPTHDVYAWYLRMMPTHDAYAWCLSMMPTHDAYAWNLRMSTQDVLRMLPSALMPTHDASALCMPTPESYCIWFQDSNPDDAGEYYLCMIFTHDARWCTGAPSWDESCKIRWLLKLWK